jgi:hypothetical protein
MHRLRAVRLPCPFAEDGRGRTMSFLRGGSPQTAAHLVSGRARGIWERGTAPHRASRLRGAVPGDRSTNVSVCWSPHTDTSAQQMRKVGLQPTGTCMDQCLRMAPSLRPSPVSTVEGSSRQQQRPGAKEAPSLALQCGDTWKNAINPRYGATSPISARPGAGSRQGHLSPGDDSPASTPFHSMHYCAGHIALKH